MTMDQTKEFNELAVKHMDTVYTAALKMMPDTLKAENLVHQTYFFASYLFETFKQSSNFEQWITDICKQLNIEPTSPKNMVCYPFKYFG